MNILHVIRTMNPAWGGPVEGIKNLAAQFIAGNHHVEVACLDEPDSPWLATLKVQANALGSAKLGKFGYSRALDSWLAENIQRFDAVIANGIWMYFSGAVRRAAMRAQIPYFVFTHGALDPWFKRHYPHKQVKKAAYWMLVEHKVLRDAAAVLFTTLEEQMLSHNAFWPYTCNAQITGYGIQDPVTSEALLTDPARVRQELQRALPTLANRKFLLYLARIHEKKGLDLLLRAIAKNRLIYQDHAFVIAGPGDPAYVSQIKALGSRLGLDDQLIWAGPLYGGAKWAAIQQAQAYVLPSHQENFGISVVEALACGVPVLITNKVNIWREIAADNGGIVETDNLQGICRLLQRWSELCPEQKTLMRDSAQRCFGHHFDIAKTSDVLFKLLARYGRRKTAEIPQICTS